MVSYIKSTHTPSDEHVTSDHAYCISDVTYQSPSSPELQQPHRFTEAWLVVNHRRSIELLLIVKRTIINQLAVRSWRRFVQFQFQNPRRNKKDSLLRLLCFCTNIIELVYTVITTWATIIMPRPVGEAGALGGHRRPSSVCPSVRLMSRTSALTRKPKGLGRRNNFAQGYPRSHATPTPTSRSKGQKSRWGGGILWRRPSRTACLNFI